MVLLVYLFSASLLAVAAFVVFRVLVRRDYLRRDRLTPFTSVLQLVVFALFFSFPYLYNPADWAWMWASKASVGGALRILALVALAIGFGLAFVTMTWFGLRRAFGFQTNGLVESGPYRLSRNPQIIGGYCLVIGTAVLFPSWYALGWVILYGFIGHMMILTEEEHLRATFGRPYQEYCQRVSRYLPLSPGRKKT